jgi:isochorismate hydrolase
VQGLGCLILDLQDVFLKVIPNRKALERRARFLVECCELLDIPLFFTEQVPEKLGATVSEVLPDGQAHHVFPKHTFSAWPLETLNAALEKEAIGHLLIAGIETPICLYQTALDARNDDFGVTILSDCIGCRRLDDAAPALNTLQQKGAYLLASETVFYSILQDTKHPKFREFTQLVKKWS